MDHVISHVACECNFLRRMSEVEGGGRVLAPEDTVLYRLYPQDGSHDCLTKLVMDCMHQARSLTAGHIWHYEPFRLVVWPEGKGL